MPADLVHTPGFEPGTCRLGGGCSILLSYACLLLPSNSLKKGSASPTLLTSLPRRTRFHPPFPSAAIRYLLHTAGA